MNIQDKIQRQLEGTYNFVEEVIDIMKDDQSFPTTMNVTYTEHDYTRDEYGVKVEEVLQLPKWRATFALGNNSTESLARNIKTYKMKFTQREFNARNSRLLEGSQKELMEHGCPLDLVYSKLVQYGYHYHKDDWDKIPMQFWHELEAREGYNRYDKILSEAIPFIEVLRPIKKKINKIDNILYPLIEQSLHETLPTVDLNKDELEIIGYILQGVKWRLNRLATKAFGNKVHNINGEKYYVTKEQTVNSFNTGFGDSTPMSILNIKEKELKKNQQDFYNKLVRIVQIEIRTMNTVPFNFNPNGTIKDIVKSYFADKMGMDKSAFRKQLSRLRAI